jgi:hypothetical protein
VTHLLVPTPHPDENGRNNDERHDKKKQHDHVSEIHNRSAPFPRPQSAQKPVLMSTALLFPVLDPESVPYLSRHPTLPWRHQRVTSSRELADV